MSGKSSAITMIFVVFPQFFQTNSGRTRWLRHGWLHANLFQSVIHLLPSRSAPDTLINSMEQCPSWEANRPLATQEIPAFYAPRRFITEFTTARHLSLSWASLIQSMPPISLLEDPFQYYPPTYAWVTQVVSFRQVSTPKHCPQLSFPPYVLPALAISFFIISSPEQYLVRSTEHKAPCYVVFSTPLLPRPS